MLNRVRVYTGTRYSDGAVALREELRGRDIDTLRVLTAGAYRPRSNHLIINWGCYRYPHTWVMMDAGCTFNYPESVDIAVHKDDALRRLREHGVSTVPFYTNRGDMFRDFADTRGAGQEVYVRHSVTGHSGEGIEIRNLETDIIPQAPLYTIGLRNCREYRVHVWDGNVISYQQKKRNTDVPDEEVNWRIRNHANGFIYAVDDISPLTPYQLEVCLNAVRRLDLDFGAVDVLVKGDRLAWVLEVNTAPGLESPTVINAYADAIQSTMENM